MKKWVLIALSFFFFSFGGKVVYGQESHLFEISLNTYFQHYEEKFSSLKETEQGLMVPGGYLSYTYVGEEKNLLFAHFSAEIVDSETSYQNILGSKGVTENQIFTFEADLGLGLSTRDKFKISGYPFEGLQSFFMYLGMGYRIWERDIGNTQTIGGYKATYKYWSFPLGLRGFYYIGDRWVGHIDLALALVYPEEFDLKLSQRSATYANGKAKADGLGVNFRFAFGVDYKVFSHFYVTATFHYNFIFVGDSKVFVYTAGGNQTVYPENTAHQVGLRIGMKLAF